jgi:hypothetical protein
MGDEFNPGSVDGKPTYEDRALYANDHHLSQGHITLPWYLRTMRALLRDRFEKGRPWGYKTPMSGYVLHYYMEQFYPVKPVLICAVRPLLTIMESCLKRYPSWTPEIAKREIPMRARFLEIVTAGHKVYKVDFSKQREESDIIEELRGYLDQEDLRFPADSTPSAGEQPEAAPEGLAAVG